MRPLAVPCLLLAFAAAAAADSATDSPRAIKRDALRVTSFDVSPRLRDMAAIAPLPTPPEESPAEIHASGSAVLPLPGDGARDAIVQGASGTASMPSPLLAFDANNSTGTTPPHPSADVGPAHIVVMANHNFEIFDKSGNRILGPLDNNTLWAGSACANAYGTHTVVTYDQLADRWLMMRISTTNWPASLCIALSTTGDPTGNYYRWSLALPPSIEGNSSYDYPRAALWPDSYSISLREVASTGTFAATRAIAFRRADMVGGFDFPRLVSFQIPAGPLTGEGLQVADFDGTRLPPPGSPPYYMGTNDASGPYGAPQDALMLWRFHADFENPENSTFTLASTLSVSPFDTNYPCPGGPRRCIPVPNYTSTQFLDIVSQTQRFMSRVSYRNLGTHEAIVCNQTVEAPTLLGHRMSGIRWYELRDPGGTPVVHQQGTYAPGVDDYIHRWNGAIAMDGQGNIALGYSVSHYEVFPGARYAGRLAGDLPLGVMTHEEATAVNGAGVQLSTNRWGDYSSLSIDPVNDCTFWLVNEYYPATTSNAWRLRVAAFRFAECTNAVGVGDPVVDRSETRVAPIGIARGPVPVRFTIAPHDAGAVTIDVIDMMGRRVRRLLDATLGPGASHATWDCRDDNGRPVSSGVFLVRLRTTGSHADQRVVVLR